MAIEEKHGSTRGNCVSFVLCFYIAFIDVSLHIQQ